MKYLFRFGYQAEPDLGTDIERSQCVWIITDNQTAAMEWGQVVADQYVADRWPNCPSWSKSRYANWVEHSDNDVIEWARRHAPTCRVGEFPSWSEFSELD